MPGEEVGVEVGVDHSHDRQAVLLRVSEVLRDIAPRVNDHCLPRRLVADQVRSMRQAVEVVLGEVHGKLLALMKSDP